MKKIISALCLLLTASNAGVARADAKWGGELYTGYGNSGDNPGFYSILALHGTNSFDMDRLGRLDVKGQINLRSNQNAIGYIDDNIFEFSATLDMDQAGKLSISNFGTLRQRPWADGEIIDRGAVNIFPDVPRRYRHIESNTTAVIIDGQVQKASRDFAIKYSNQFGQLGFEVVTDPFKIYGPTWGNDVQTADGTGIPVAEIHLTYPTPLGIYQVWANDLGDIELYGTYPIGKTGLVFIASYANNGEDRSLYNADLTALYHSEDTGIFKGFFLTYTQGTPGLKRVILSTDWGVEKFTISLAVDTGFNTAAEAYYQFTDHVTGYVGVDSGYKIFSGFDETYQIPVLAEPRGVSFEIGTKVTF